MLARLSISRTFYHQYQWPYSDCGVLEDGSLVIDLKYRSIFDIVVQSKYTYTRKACLSVCTQVKTSSVCGCNSRRIDYKVPNVVACSLADELNCALDIWNSVESLHDFCSNNCPFECAQSVFQVDINYADQSITNYLYSYIFDNYYWCLYYILYFNWDSNCETSLFTMLDFTYLYQDTSQVAIRYESLAYKKLEEEPKINGEELLGIIGGHLGLFLGMSLLSFVELIEFVFLACARLVRPKAKNKVLDPIFIKQSTVLRQPDKTRGISNKLREYVFRLNIAAVPNIFRARHDSLAVIWFVLFIGGLGICLFLVVNSVFHYTSYAVSTSVLYSDSINTKYVTIAVCNIHRFNTEYAFKLIKNMTGFDPLNFSDRFGKLYYIYNYMYITKTLATLPDRNEIPSKASHLRIQQKSKINSFLKSRTFLKLRLKLT